MSATIPVTITVTITCAQFLETITITPSSEIADQEMTVVTGATGSVTFSAFTVVATYCNEVDDMSYELVITPAIFGQSVDFIDFEE